MALTGALAILCGALPVVGGTKVLQFVAAGIALLGVLIVTRRWPVQGTLIALTLLPFLAVVRRLINPSTSAGDPLLVLPAAFALLCLSSPRSKQPERTAMGTIVFLLMFVIGVQVLNPLQGPLRVGIVGAVLMSTPLFWFFVGRAVCTPRLLRQAANVLIVTALVVGLYGLKQTFFGFAGFEKAWIDSHFETYIALSVAGQIRAFSTFSSSAEYGLYAGMGAAAAVVIWRGWRRWVTATFLIACTFLTGSRGIFLTSAAALLVVLGAGRLRSLTRGVLILVPLIGLLGIGANFVPVPQGESTAAVLTRRSITGLASPFDSQKSTAGTHANNVRLALDRGFGQPAGYGPGAVNQAGLALGGKTYSGESDFSDILVALGYPGELLLFALYLALFKAANAGVRRDRLLLVPAALALVTFNTWFVGGLYAVTATLWFAIGALDRASSLPEEDAEHAEPVRARALAITG
jgi:hypothetical protein